jgi:lipoate-protein ligase B
LVRALETLGVQAGVRNGLTGVWSNGRKIASIGIHVRRWVTCHGFALNVTTDPAAFGAIVPCGIQGVEMTSVARELGGISEPAGLWNRTRQAVVEALGRTFDREPTPAVLDRLATTKAPSNNENTERSAL